MNLPTTLFLEDTRLVWPISIFFFYYYFQKRGGQRSFDSALSSPRSQQTSSPRFIFNPHGSSHHSSSGCIQSSCGHSSPRSSNGHSSPRSSNGHGSPRHSGGSPRHSPRSGHSRMGGFSSGKELKSSSVHSIMKLPIKSCY